MTPDAPPAPETRHLDIRKYPNRRYYDATRSRHLTLEDIRTVVREGWEVTVTDSKTGGDITAQVLTQIILELETPKLDVLPVPLLLHLIRFNDPWMKEFVDTYFRKAFEAFLSYQKQVEEGVRGFPGNLFGPFGSWPASLFTGFGTTTGPAPASEAGASGSRATPGASSETEELRRAIETLRGEVAALKGKLQGGGRGAGGRRRRAG